MGQKQRHSLSQYLSGIYYTAQKIKFSTKDFPSKCDQIRRELRIWSHSRKKSPTENLIFCTVSGFCSHPLQQYSTTMKTLGVSSIIKFRAQVDIRRNLSPDFVMTKVARRDCYRSVSSSIVIRNGKISHLSLSNNYVLRNFKTIFCFHNSTIRINILKF